MDSFSFFLSFLRKKCFFGFFFYIDVRKMGRILHKELFLLVLKDVCMKFIVTDGCKRFIQKGLSEPGLCYTNKLSKSVPSAGLS